MNNKEIKLNELFNAMRGRIVGRFAYKFNGFGADVEDAVAVAFKYAALKLLAKKGEPTALDLECVMNWKMRKLFEDARAASKRTHGRRSVKALAILDEDQENGDEYRTPILDKVAVDRFAGDACDKFSEARFVLQTQAMEIELKRDGMSDRDYDIFDRTTFCAADRKALAAEYRTSVNNINRIHCEAHKRALALAPQIRNRYRELVHKLAA